MKNSIKEEYRLGDYYRNKGNYKTAITHFKKAACTKDCDAILNIACIYEHYLHDYKNAIKWYKKGAELNDSDCINNLASLYSNGQGVRKNASLAIKLYLKGAKLTNSLCMSNLGRAYEIGEGVTQSYALALHWYKKAFKNGLKETIEDIKRIKGDL